MGGLASRKVAALRVVLVSYPVALVLLTALALPMGERPTLAQAASMIDAAIEASDRYYPAFDFMVRGNKKPQEAIDACLFETVGTA